MILTLKDTKASASIDSLGAQLISYRDSAGQEYIWQRDPSYWANCSTILFPIVGGLKENHVRIGETFYTMPKHGFVKSSELEARQEEPDRAVFTLKDSEETRSMYPFPFLLTVTYTLKDGALTMICRVENTGSSPLPYFIGTHPGFVCPLLPGESFSDYVLEFDEDETEGYRAFDPEHQQFDMSRRLPFPGDGRRIALNYELFLSDAIWFDNPRSRKVRLLQPATGRGVEVGFADYATVAFWTAAEKQAPFLCIEPWNGSGPCSDEGTEFLGKNHLQTLQPGESREYAISIRYLQV